MALTIHPSITEVMSKGLTDPKDGDVQHIANCDHCWELVSRLLTAINSVYPNSPIQQIHIEPAQAKS